MQVGFNTSFLNFSNLTLAKNNMRVLKEDGYQKVGKINMLDQDGATVKGNVYLRDKNGHIDVVSTNNECARIGYLGASSSCYEPDNILVCSIENYMNLHTAKPWEQKGKIKGYKGVGSRLYVALEDYLRENRPDIDELRVYVTNSGSWDFHTKQGFVGYGDEYDTYAIHPKDNTMYKKLKNK